MAQSNIHATPQPPASVLSLEPALLDAFALLLDQGDLHSLSLTCHHLVGSAYYALYSAPRLSSSTTNRHWNSHATINHSVDQLYKFVKTLSTRQDLAERVKDLQLVLHPAKALNCSNDSNTLLDNSPTFASKFFLNFARKVGLESAFEEHTTLALREGHFALILSRCPNLGALEIEFEVLSFNEDNQSYEPPIDQDTPCRAFGLGVSRLIRSALAGTQPYQAFAPLEQLEIRSFPPTNALTECPPFVKDFLRIPSLRKYTSANFFPLRFPTCSLTYLDLKNSEALHRQPASVTRRAIRPLYKKVDPLFLAGCNQLEELKTIAPRGPNDLQSWMKDPIICQTLLIPVAATLKHLTLHVPSTGPKSKKDIGTCNDLRGIRWLQYVDLSLFSRLETLDLAWSLLAILTFQPTSVQTVAPRTLPLLRKVEVCDLNPLNIYDGDWFAFETEISTTIQGAYGLGIYPSLDVFKVWVDLPVDGQFLTDVLRAGCAKAEKVLSGLKKWRGQMPFGFAVRSSPA